MTGDKMYSILKFLARKNQLGGLPPSQFEYAINTGQRNYFDFLLGRVEQYQYGRAVPRVGLAMTDSIVTKLSPFQKESTLTVTASKATKPANCVKIYAVYTTAYKRLTRIEETQLAERLADSIDPIDEDNAFYVERGDSLVIYPTLASVKVVFYEPPIDIKWDYSLDGNGRPVYKPVGTGDSTSTNPQWLENDCDEVIARALKIVGASFKDAASVQYGESVIQKGE